MSQNPFEEIRSRLSVVEVLGSYLDIKHSGRNYRAVCPFHKEKSGSLMISPDRDIWHCFGCGVGGNIFSFVEMYENVDKKTALSILAKKSGVTLQNFGKDKSETQQQSQKTVDIYTQGQKYLGWASALYHQILLKILTDTASPITKYCKERGWDMATIIKFQIGYAPKNDFLLGIAITHKMNTDLLQAIGLIKKLDEKNILKDKFADRLMIPITDKNSFTVGFTGRVLPYDTNASRPKYLNSSQSQWFNKSGLWYGLAEHSFAIRQRKEVIIVEGNMDVIKANQVGLDYALASQGTSFTVEQLLILKRLTTKVLLAFDNDLAGVIASKKFFRQAVTLGFEVQKVIIDTQYKDLDDMLSANFDNLRGSLKTNLQTMPFLDYILSVDLQSLQSNDSGVQKQVLLDFLYLLAVCDPISKEQYIQKLMNITKFSKGLLMLELTKQPTEKIDIYNESSTVNSATQTLPDNLVNIHTIIPAITNTQIINLNWQKLVATGYDTDLVKLKLYFPLLQVICKPLQNYTDLQDYYNKNNEELGFISDRINQENADTKTAVSTTWQVINGFLDQNVGQFLMNNHLKDTYMLTKNNY